MLTKCWESNRTTEQSIFFFFAGSRIVRLLSDAAAPITTHPYPDINNTNNKINNGKIKIGSFPIMDYEFHAEITKARERARQKYQRLVSARAHTHTALWSCIYTYIYLCNRYWDMNLAKDCLTMPQRTPDTYGKLIFTYVNIESRTQFISI